MRLEFQSLEALLPEFSLNHYTMLLSPSAHMTQWLFIIKGIGKYKRPYHSSVAGGALTLWFLLSSLVLVEKVRVCMCSHLVFQSDSLGSEFWLNHFLVGWPWKNYIITLTTDRLYFLYASHCAKCSASTVSLS